MIKIAYVLNVKLEFDTRAQKEIAELLRNGAALMICSWDKENNSCNVTRKIKIREFEHDVTDICIKVQKGKGFRENIFSLIKYELKLFLWLLKNRKKYDYIHAADMDSAFSSLIAAKLFRKRLVYDIFDDYADSHIAGAKIKALIRKIDAVIIKHSDSVIICSEKRREQLALIPERLTVIHNTPDIKTVQKDLMPVLANDKLKIAYIGNLYPGRFTIEMAHIAATHKDFELYCAGAGSYENELRRLAAECSNIHFYGVLPYEKVLSLESNCDVIPALYDPGFPNHKYAAPNKFYEALYLGKPTIMVHDTGMDKYVDEFKTGLTIEYDVKDLTAAFEKIHADINIWRQQEKRIKDIYRENFSWPLMAERLMNIYKG